MIRLALLSMLFPVAVHATDITPYHLVDVIYSWPSAISNLRFDLRIDVVPGMEHSMFWSHYFQFADTGGPNDGDGARGGYTGFQIAHGKKIAIFSIWNALRAEGQNCEPFGGEGNGYHCNLKIKYREGRTYQFLVTRESSSESGDWWSSIIVDAATGNTYNIGRILSPPNSGGIVRSYLFSEYFMPLPNCQAIPYSKIAFLNFFGDNTLRPDFTGVVPMGPCQSFARVRRVNDGVLIEAGVIRARGWKLEL